MKWSKRLFLQNEKMLYDVADRHYFDVTNKRHGITIQTTSSTSICCSSGKGILYTILSVIF